MPKCQVWALNLVPMANGSSTANPFTLIFLIRPDGDGTRKPMGDYVANQLETIGFTVDRQYKTSSEAFPIWLGTTASGWAMASCILPDISLRSGFLAR